MISLSTQQKIALLQISLSFAAVFLVDTAWGAAASISAPGGAWASSGTPGTTPGTDNSRTLSNARAGDNVSITGTGNTLAIQNNGTANDGTGLNTFNVGAVTDTATGNTVVQTASDNDVQATIGSVDILGAFTSQTTDDYTGSTNTTISGAFQAGSLNVINNENSAPSSITSGMTVTGNFMASGGAVSVQGGVNVANTSILTLNGASIGATSFTLQDGTAGSATIKFGNAAQSITGTINGSDTNKGTVEVTSGGNATFSGVIGGNKSLAQFKITGGTSATAASADKNLSATNFILDDGGASSTLTLTGSTQTLTGAINGQGAEEGSVVVAGTGVTLDGNIGSTTRLSNFTVNTGKVATLSSSTSSLRANTILNNGTLTVSTASDIGGAGLASGTITNAGILTLNEKVSAHGTTLALGTGSISMGTITYTNNTMINVTDVGTVNATLVTVLPHSIFNQGTITVIKDMAAGTASDPRNFTAASTLITDYAFTLVNNEDIAITAQAKSPSTVARAIGGKATDMDAMALTYAATDTSSNSTVQTAILNAVAAGGSQAEIAAKQLSLNPTQSAPLIANGMTQVVANTLSARLAEVRQSDTNLATIKSTGLSAGNIADSVSIWVRPYAYFGKQDEIENVAGYQSKTYGLMGGIDRPITEKIRAGMSAGYSNANVHGAGVGNHQTDVNAYQFAFYADYALNQYFMNGLVGYNNNHVNTSRSITFGGLNHKALGDYHADQYFARIEGGKTFTVAPNHLLTPTVGVDYSRLDSSVYTEKGAGVLNLYVDPDTVDVALLTTTLKYNYKRPVNSGFVNHVVRLGAGYDFVDDNGIATVKFQSGSSAFQTTAPNISPLEGHAGLGLGYNSSDNVQNLSLDYDAEFRQAYVGHTLKLEWRYNF